MGYSLVSSLKISCQSVKGQETSLSQPLLLGGGPTAKISENSIHIKLVFRDAPRRRSIPNGAVQVKKLFADFDNFGVYSHSTQGLMN